VLMDLVKSLVPEWNLSELNQPDSSTGLQDYSWNNTYVKMEKYLWIYQMTTKCTKWHKNSPNSNNIYQHFPSKGLQKYTEIGTCSMQI
jgi:hypothetical protein